MGAFFRFRLVDPWSDGRMMPRNGITAGLRHRNREPRNNVMKSMAMDWSKTFCFLLTSWLAVPGFHCLAGNEAPKGIRVADGFQVSLFADDDLAHDIYSMTIDTQGRVVVSGAGYIKILEDTNGDGQADRVKLFADGPQTGSQGMCFHGRDLLCTGDGGLLRFRDRDGDDRADGEPDLFLKIKAGGEHDAHAIRRGPDGYWYLMAGNSSGVGTAYVTSSTSPIRQPHDGVLLRLSPDLTKGEIVGHGFRNAYDFDFSAEGEILTYDSDGERDISLPWYRPTRLFQVLPGSDAGFVSRSWKRPGYFVDMMPVLARLGRGSPTGVVCYKQTAFPEPYQGAFFVADWTYGRVIALPLKQKESRLATEPILFMSGTGEHGFAPTDLAVGPDGALYVSVGGRNTRGGVYRITAVDHVPDPWPDSKDNSSPAEQLNVLLSIPDPLSSWSRFRWEPRLEELHSEPLILAARDQTRPRPQRIRAIEILVEKYQGIDSDLLISLADDPDAAIRSRAAWAAGRSQPAYPKPTELVLFLDDPDPVVVRTALESLLGAEPDALSELAKPLGRCLGHADPLVRQVAARVVLHAEPKTYRRISEEAIQHGWPAAMALAAAYVERHQGIDPYAIDIALRVLQRDSSVSMKREAARLLQRALGDVGPARDSQEKRPAVYDGYSASLDLASAPKERDGINQAMEQIFPTGDSLTDYELARVLAMTTPESLSLCEKLLSKITAESSPVDDIHYLIVISRLQVQRSNPQRQKLADVVIQIESKIQQHHLRQDRNWDDRFLEMYTQLVLRDPALPQEVLRHPRFGLPGHAILIEAHPKELRQPAIATYQRRLLSNPEQFSLTPELVELLAEIDSDEVRAVFRSRIDDYRLRDAILSALAKQPVEDDRALFLAGLESSRLNTLGVCLRALGTLNPSRTAEDNIALIATLRRLGERDVEAKIRDRVIRLLRRNTGLAFGYKFDLSGEKQQVVIDQWTQAISSMFPEAKALQEKVASEDVIQFLQRLSAIDWTKGDAVRGRDLFEKRACAQCHGSRRALGPDLSGVTIRFSRDDLFTAIVDPNRDVSPRYQTTLIVTKNGTSHTGLIAYESVDGLVLRDAGNRTIRIASDDIEFRRPAAASIMPANLLNGLTDQELADLYAYLTTLGRDR